MHNVINTTATEISILDRAIKARNRRDRDGKKRRPVTDGLIEYAAQMESKAISAEACVASLRLDADVLRDVISKQSDTISAMEEEISALNAKVKQIQEAASNICMDSSI